MAKLSWKDKYTLNAVHADPVIRTKIKYVDEFGREIEVPHKPPRAPVMAKGRGPQIYDSDVILVTTTARNTDLDELINSDFQPKLFKTPRRARQISDMANEDIDMLRSRSRRQDRAFLENINNTLTSPDSMTYGSLPPTAPKRYVSNGPLFSGRRASISAAYPLSVHDSPIPVPRMRRPATASARPATAASMRMRSASPSYRTPLQRYPSPSSTYRAPLISTSTPGTKRAISEPPNTASMDSAIRNARQQLKRIENDLSFDDDFGDDDISYSRRSKPRHQYTVTRETVPYRSIAPIVTPVVTHTFHTTPVPRSRPRSSSVPPPMSHHRYRSASAGPIPRSSALLSHHHHHHLVDAEVADGPKSYGSSLYGPSSMSSLRHRTNEAKNKMDVHKSMMDRYLPIYLGPETEVQYEVDHKFGELVQRMPSLDPYRPGIRGPIEPYRPANLPPRPPPNQVMPQTKMSNARKQARAVLCRTKNDPHYFG